MATWDDVNRKISTSNGPADKCPTKAEIEATGKGKVNSSVGKTQLVNIDQVSSALPEKISLEFSVAAQYSEIRECYIDGVAFDEYSPVSIEANVFEDGRVTFTVEIKPNYNNQQFIWSCLIMGVENIQSRPSSSVGNVDFEIGDNSMLYVKGVASTNVDSSVLTTCTYDGIELDLDVYIVVYEPYPIN